MFGIGVLFAPDVNDDIPRIFNEHEEEFREVVSSLFEYDNSVHMGNLPGHYSRAGEFDGRLRDIEITVKVTKQFELLCTPSDFCAKVIRTVEGFIPNIFVGVTLFQLDGYRSHNEGE